MRYQDAILWHSAVWGARRASTGELIEFNPQVADDGTWTEWTYTFPVYLIQQHYRTLDELAREMWAASEARDWIPLGPAVVLPDKYRRRFSAPVDGSSGIC